MKVQDGSRLLFGLGSLTLAVLLVAGCTALSGRDETPPAAGDGAERLSVTGSTTVLPIAQALAEGFMAANPGTDILISAGGSSVGITAVGEGTAEIGMASRELKEAETARYPDLRPVAIAQDGIVIIVNPENGVRHLSLEQIRAIYAGAVTNWQEVGGADRPVVAIGRDSASGTREFFDEEVMDGTATMRLMLEKNSNGAIQVSVAPNPNAIGYIGFGYVDPTVRAIALEVNGTAVAPTVANVLGGTYPLARELYFVTNGTPTGLAKDFVAFALSGEGQRIVEQQGFVPVEPD
jgi:phosphate transport system substrate-binding protein